MVRNRGFIIVILFVMLLLTMGNVLAKVSAQVDRNTVSDIETVRFIISTDKKSDPPDLSALNKDFDILGTSTSSRVNIVNGRMSSTYEWVTTLAPKRSGKLVIPSVTVAGEKTKPVTITVSKGGVDAGVSKEIFIQTSVKPAKPYVQSQVVFTIRFHHAIELLKGSLSTPEVENAVTERLGEDITYMKTINGRRFRVTERNYAIFPQVSGPMSIPEIVFDGEIADNRSGRSGAFDSFFSSAFQRGRAVRLRSKKQTLNVLPKPSSAKGSWWLPAKKLSLTEEWSPKEPEFRVGEPVTRTLTVTATGLTEAQLPDLGLKETRSFRLYPDQENKQTRSDKNNVTGIKQQKIAFVPTMAGKTTIPEITINWWDTEKNKARVARIPSRTIKVLPALSSATPAISGGLPANAANTLTLGENTGASGALATSAEKIQKHPLTSSVWAWLTGVFLLLWLLTASGWLYQAYLRPRRLRMAGMGDTGTARLSKKQSFSQVRQACQDNNPAATRDAVLQWAQCVWPDNAIRNLGDVAGAIDDEELKTGLRHLDGILYSGTQQQWEADEFWQSFSKLDRSAEATTTSDSKVIHDLYPA